MDWSGPWHMGGMGIWWILIVGAVVAVIWFVTSSFRRGAGSEESPEQALKRRYAKGEIDRETYERMLGDLRK